MFCQCLRGRTNLATSTFKAPPRPQRIGQIYAFKFELCAQECQTVVIGRIVPKKGIMFVFSVNTVIG